MTTATTAATPAAAGPEYRKLNEEARRVGMDHRRLRTAVRGGALPAYVWGRRYYLRPDDVDDWVRREHRYVPGARVRGAS